MTSKHLESIHFVSNKIKSKRFMLSVIRYIAEACFLVSWCQIRGNQWIGGVSQTLREFYNFPGFEDQAPKVLSESF